MKISALQTDIAWADPERNFTHLETALERCAGETGAGLIVLPEMFTTGFMADPAGAADTGRALDWLRQEAGRLGTALAGSVATHTDDGRYANRLWLVRPDGTADRYDKAHLFSPGLETRHYEAGRRRVVAECGGLRILLQICYDLRFPVFARNRGDYDAAIYVASWPASRIGAWTALLRARAIENQCYVLGVNRVGSDPQTAYPGASIAVGPRGEVLAEAPEAVETWITADFDPAPLEAFRKKFPVLADADAFRLC